jgi:hypothetical protein
MHFFKKLFGAVSSYKKKNDYTLATLEYATGHRAYHANALICQRNRLPALRTCSDYDRPVSNYTTKSRTNAGSTINILNIAVPGIKQKRTITITSYKAHASDTGLFIHRS